MSNKNDIAELNDHMQELQLEMNALQRQINKLVEMDDNTSLSIIYKIPNREFKEMSDLFCYIRGDHSIEIKSSLWLTGFDGTCEFGDWRYEYSDLDLQFPPEHKVFVESLLVKEKELKDMIDKFGAEHNIEDTSFIYDRLELENC
jgi:hypothetical protein